MNRRSLSTYSPVVKLNRVYHSIYLSQHPYSSKQIGLKCADRDLPCPQNNLHGIKTMANIWIVEHLQIPAGGITQGFLLIGTDGFRGTPELIIGTGAHLDKDEHVAIPADEINLTPRRAEIAIKHAITFAPQKCRGDPLAVGTDFSRCLQSRRRRVPGPV